MKLVVGLGNPGKKYTATRHNIGFMVVDELIRRYGSGSPRKQFQGEVTEAKLGSEKTLLLCPHTFMNVSGVSVRAAVDFYKIEIPDVFVICDDMNLPVGKLRVRAKGSSGGQKGLADIVRHLGTEEVARLRIGIDRPGEGRENIDYVLGKFSKDEAADIAIAIQHAADATNLWATENIAACMNRYNA
jgi:PTH1 family peptidyl-tRNA hydrolase